MKNTKDTNKKEGNGSKYWIVSTILLFGCIVGFIGGIIFDKNILSEKLNSQTSDKNTNFTRVEITKKLNLDSAIKGIKTTLDEVWSKPIYVEVQTGENEYEAYLYNSHKEAVAQTSSMSSVTIFTNNNHSIRANFESEGITIDNSIDIYSTVRNVLNNIESGMEGYSLYQVIYDDSKENDYLYYDIDVVGMDACIAVYSSVGENFGKTLIESVASYIGNDWTPHLRFGFAYKYEDEKPLISMSCNIVVDDVENSNWICYGYNNTEDWQLSEDWYTTEFNKDNADKISEMLDKTLSDIEKKLGLNNPNDSKTEISDNESKESDNESKEENSSGETSVTSE